MALVMELAEETALAESKELSDISKSSLLAMLAQKRLKISVHFKAAQQVCFDFWQNVTVLGTVRRPQ